MRAYLEPHAPFLVSVIRFPFLKAGIQLLDVLLMVCVHFLFSIVSAFFSCNLLPFSLQSQNRTAREASDLLN